MTTEAECLEALQRAAERLGESPTKAAYEELGLAPASATIMKIERKDRRRSEIRRWLYRYKDRNCKCARCDEDRPLCLDFHHPNEKERSVATMVVNGHSKESIREEIERCVVLCANCHRLDHLDAPANPEAKPEPDNHK